MEADKIIEQMEKFQAQLITNTGGGVEIAAPGVCSEIIVKVRILLVQLVDKVYEAEREYRHAKAARFNKFLDEGHKRTPAQDLLDYEEDLIDMKLTTEKIRNYMKYVDGLVSAVQSLLKVQSSSEKNQY